MTSKEEKVVQRVVQAEGTACAKLLNEKEHESLAARAGDSVLAIRVGGRCAHPKLHLGLSPWVRKI